MLPNTMRQKLKHLRTKRRLEVVVAVSVVLALLLLCWANGRREKDPVRHLRTKTMKGGGGQVMDTPGLKSGVGDIVLAEIAPRPDGFFFSETSGRPYLTAREVCSVESAAKHHVNNTFHVVMTSPHVEWSGPLRDVSKEYPNIFFRHVDFESFVMSSPLSMLWRDGRLASSHHVVSHTSDLLRFLLLHRFGGTYLDLDQIVVQKFPEDVPNFIGQENDKYVAVGVLRFQRGHPFLSEALSLLSSSFSPSEWSGNGPFLATRVLRERICAPGWDSAIPKSSPSRCLGIVVFRRAVFYPVNYREWKVLFDASKTTEVLVEFVANYTLSVHAWGKQSSEVSFFEAIKTKNAYSTLAEINCPVTYQWVKEKDSKDRY